MSRKTTTTLLGAVAMLAIATTGIAQITENPLPEPIEKRGLRVAIADIARLPRTDNLLPPEQDAAGYARVSFVRDIADGRRFANDSRGFLYLLRNGTEPSLYLDFHALYPRAFYNRLESGLIGFDFHPEFAENGLFYTVHAESADGNPETVDFTPPGYSPDDANYHNVYTEWRATDPAANQFSGTRRELLRVAHIVESLSHPMGYVGFNPTAEPDEDYGLIYTSGSDLGFSNGAGPEGNNPGQTQRLDTVVTAILRIDPRSPADSGGVRGLGDYTIPPGNPFANDGDPNTLGEIYAHGFRNAHRLSWDWDDGTMFALDIGMSQIEEVNIVHAGGNYGWMAQEAYWENGINRPGGRLNQIYPLPESVVSGETPNEFTYPVAIYDHDEGRAISGGFVYHGEIEALQGKFVFGDLSVGRVFASDVAALKAADDGVPRTVAPIEEIQLFVRDANGGETNVSFMDLIERANGEAANRADMHIGQSADGEIFVTSRQDGTIRMLVP
jgi:glucose/arabinose dehydrogenase